MEGQVTSIEIVRRLSQKARFSGSAYSKECAKYITAGFRDCGLTVETFESPFMGWSLEEGALFRLLKPQKKDITALPLIWSGSTPAQGVEGSLVYAGKMITYDTYVWDKYIIRGSDKQDAAWIIGASGRPWIQSLDNPSVTIPCVMVDSETNKILRRWIQSGEEVKSWLRVKTAYHPDSYFCNILGTLIGSKPESSRIMVCAHYDSVYNSPGANDNASGIAALLTLAGSLSRERYPKNIDFVAFDGEEWNKLGSTYYAAILSQQQKLRSIDVVINADLIGAGNTIYLYYDMISQSEELRRQVKSRLAEALNEAIKNEENVDIQLLPQAGPLLDCYPFYRAGIPIIHVLCSPYEHLHSKGDTFDKIDPNMLDKTISVIRKLVDFLATSK